MAELRFVAGSVEAALDARKRDVFVLSRTGWDDYSHKITFELSYIDESGAPETIGNLKILGVREAAGGRVVVQKETALAPGEFLELPAGYISLGQDEGYYIELRRQCGQVVGEAVLEALADIAWQPALADELEPISAFRNGLVRYNAAKRARRLGARLIAGETPYEEPSFTYRHDVGDEEPLEIGFPFDPDDAVPGRIIGLIGRNAVGKTTLMARLASDLAQTRKISAEALDDQISRFGDKFPLFTRVVAVSYSAFDKFKRPDPKLRSSYVYCGIRDERGNLTQKALRENFENNKERIREARRQDQWTDAILSVLGEADNSALRAHLELDIKLETVPEESFFETLSSGQAILCHMVTGLLGWLQPNSLVLFDEPETHLHPNAVANLFQALSKILKVTDSVAILATHSPIVIQEIPAKRVLWMRFDDGGLVVEPLGLESFGESLSELTRHVFETSEVDHLYKTVLARLSKERSFEEVMTLFRNGLSSNAQAYLLGQYAQRARR